MSIVKGVLQLATSVMDMKNACSKLTQCLATPISTSVCKWVFPNDYQATYVIAHNGVGILGSSRVPMHRQREKESPDA